jgi:flagellar biosynthetic protein FliP
MPTPEQRRRARPFSSLSPAALVLLGVLGAAVVFASAPQAAAQESGGEPAPMFSFRMEGERSPGQMTVVMEIFLLLTVLTLAPAILIMLTSFTRIVVVLSVLRQAIGTQQMPPNQVIIGLALFLTFFVMNPVWQAVNREALQPYLAGELPQQDALDKAVVPLRQFMYRQTREKDLALMVEIARVDRPRSVEDVPTAVLVPSFIMGELKTAFQIGFLLYVPFLIIDMVVASVLLSMGMMMLPPVMISLPFKLMLFVLVDGWHLIVGSLVKSFV